MTNQTINNDVTLTGGENPLLAGRYQVVRQLGTGGMGSVWLAEDTQLDNKPFAVKMLPSILVSNKRAYRQLKDEAIVAMKLVHPNIVQIRAFEENNGNPFLVMDYIEGQTLDDCLEEWGTLSEEETVALLMPVAEALDYAHSQGVVHRDIKPANVMIRADGTPFVLDFGIAREIQETMTHVTGKLSSGTLLYMSPEQLRGQQPNATQDVYSFAAMAYECLKGEPPFSRGQIEYQILNETPAKLQCETWLSASIMLGLSKTPHSRPDTCIGILFPNSAVTQDRISEPRESKNLIVDKGFWQQRRIKTMIVGSVICIVGFSVLCGVVWHHNNTRKKVERHRTIVTRQVEAARQQDEESTGTVAEAARKNEKEERLARQKEDPKRKTQDKGSLLAIERELAKEKEPGVWLPKDSQVSTQTAGNTSDISECMILPRNPKHLQTATVELPGGVGMQMIYCAPGDYVWGTDKAPMRMNHGFWLGKYEVMQFQWKSVMGITRGWFWQGDDLPVTDIMWHQSKEFARKITEYNITKYPGAKFKAKLPDQYEWEYACRAGTSTMYSWGDSANGYQCNCNGTIPVGSTVNGPYLAKPVQVHKYKPNNWGFYNMLGNVAEWCHDDAAVENHGHGVLRGGSFFSYPRDCRVTSWEYAAQSFCIGMRLCVVVE